jgi:lipopolysaccharide/colanic/teichoic acid biosynthesis glycosyltransferase
VEYLPRYNSQQKHRHDVLPGLTGWAQVNGRNGISWEEKFRLDLEYIRDVSFGLDIKIILMTVGKIFKREGISSETSETMEDFMGTPEHEVIV